MPSKRDDQLPLFPAAGNVHALGLLGWKDPLWTRKFSIELISGAKLTLDLATIRRLHVAVKAGVAAADINSPFASS